MEYSAVTKTGNSSAAIDLESRLKKDTEEIIIFNTTSEKQKKSEKKRISAKLVHNPEKREFSLLNDCLTEHYNQRFKPSIVWSFTSGKGGVGKTTIAGVTARRLALDKNNYKVLLVDADHGGQNNIHHLFGKQNNDNKAILNMVENERYMLNKKNLVKSAVSEYLDSAIDVLWSCGLKGFKEIYKSFNKDGITLDVSIGNKAGVDFSDDYSVRNVIGNIIYDKMPDYSKEITGAVMEYVIYDFKSRSSVIENFKGKSNYKKILSSIVKNIPKEPLIKSILRSDVVSKFIEDVNEELEISYFGQDNVLKQICDNSIVNAKVSEEEKKCLGLFSSQKNYNLSYVDLAGNVKIDEKNSMGLRKISKVLSYASSKLGYDFVIIDNGAGSNKLNDLSSFSDAAIVVVNDSVPSKDGAVAALESISLKNYELTMQQALDGGFNAKHVLYGMLNSLNKKDEGEDLCDHVLKKMKSLKSDPYLCSMDYLGSIEELTKSKINKITHKNILKSMTKVLSKRGMKEDDIVQIYRGLGYTPSTIKHSIDKSLLGYYLDEVYTSLKKQGFKTLGILTYLAYEMDFNHKDILKIDDLKEISQKDPEAFNDIMGKLSKFFYVQDESVNYKTIMKELEEQGYLFHGDDVINDNSDLLAKRLELEYSSISHFMGAVRKEKKSIDVASDIKNMISSCDMLRAGAKLNRVADFESKDNLRNSRQKELAKKYQEHLNYYGISENHHKSLLNYFCGAKMYFNELTSHFVKDNPDICDAYDDDIFRTNRIKIIEKISYRNNLHTFMILNRKDPKEKKSWRDYREELNTLVKNRLGFEPNGLDYVVEDKDTFNKANSSNWSEIFLKNAKEGRLSKSIENCVTTILPSAKKKWAWLKFRYFDRVCY